MQCVIRFGHSQTFPNYNLSVASPILPHRHWVFSNYNSFRKSEAILLNHGGKRIYCLQFHHRPVLSFRPKPIQRIDSPYMGPYMPGPKRAPNIHTEIINNQLQSHRQQPHSLRHHHLPAPSLLLFPPHPLTRTPLLPLLLPRISPPPPSSNPNNSSTRPQTWGSHRWRIPRDGYRVTADSRCI